MIDLAEYGRRVPLPISKKKLNQLGARIAAGDSPAGADLVQLKEVLRAYQAILDTVEEQLTQIDLRATTRVKTRSVLIEKLRREGGMELARVQDLAGARIVVDGDWAEQDAVVARVASHFDGWTGKQPRVVDRRLRPSHGYRAVHVIVFPDGVPVEIQVRTEVQNNWAQIVERLADRWGRGLRYGEDPQDAGLPAEGVAFRDGGPVSRAEVIRDLREVSDEISLLEVAEREMVGYWTISSVSLEKRIEQSLQREVGDLDVDATLFYLRLRASFKKLINTAMSPGTSPLLRFRSSGVRRVKRYVGRFIRRTVPNVKSPDADFVRVKLRGVDTIVVEVAEELRSRLKVRQATLRDTLQRLAEYVEQGGIR
ncbi:hypothetical protein [Actinoplanes sp. NPDC026619]|uniref:hypothetical protein n=1 Tax=Actinoplanes sp. NPDC026619 TaxID=3155798 RepID=UPI0033C45674